MEILRALGSLAESPDPPHPELAAALDFATTPDKAAYSDIFLFQLFPFASVYLGPEGMVGGEVRSRLVDFYRTLGSEPGMEPDHISSLLAFQASLADAHEQAESERDRDGWHNARRAHLWEHLLSWLPFYLDRMDQLATGFYSDWARLLRNALTAEAETAGRSIRLPLHLREAPTLQDPRREGGKALLDALLSPVRCGMILTRSDLARAAGDTGLGSRVGERRFALEALLGQDPGTVLGWLADEADTTSRRHAKHQELLGDIATFWSDRAAGAAELLRDLAADA